MGDYPLSFDMCPKIHAHPSGLVNGLCTLSGLSACNPYRCSINCSNNDRVDEGECMSNSVQRMAKAGENIRKLGFCMAAVFAGMLVAFAALVVYVIWYAVENVASVDSFGVVTLLDGGCIVIPSGLCLALVVGISLVVLCGISRNISRGVSPFTRAHVRLIRVLALALAVNAAVSFVGAYGSVNLTIGGLELCIVPHSFVIEICQGATFDAGSFIGAVVCLFISAIWSYASLLQEQSDELV